MHNPWRTFGRTHPDWEVRFGTLPDGVDGYTDTAVRMIVIDRRLNQAERRSTLAHEAIHAARLDLDCSEEDETAVEQMAARILIPLDRLIDAILWTSNPAEGAEELWVDLPMLQCRIDHLHPSERATIRAALSRREESA